MVKWYLATYQNGIFSNDLGIIQPSEDYVYKLKDAIDSGESPKKEDWLRITIADNKVEEWDGSSWTDASLTGLVNNSTYWVYGTPYSYRIVTNDQTHYLKSFSNIQSNNTRIITGIDINDSDVTIDDVANITSVIIGNSVTEIGDYAFQDCLSLASLTIPDSVTSIGISAFYACSKLASVTIGDSVTEIGEDAFFACEKLASMTIPDSVTEIGNYAFAYCSRLASVTIPDSVETIGKEAFWNCTNLAFVTIPDSVTSIGTGAFYGIGIKIVHYTYITISQSTVRRLKESDYYDSGNTYPDTFFSGSTYINIIVT